MHIGRIQRTLTVEPIEEPVPGHRRPAPVEPAPVEPAPVEAAPDPRREHVPAAARIREGAIVG